MAAVEGQTGQIKTRRTELLVWEGLLFRVDHLMGLGNSDEKNKVEEKQIVR
jgi:hypothetical protein